MNLFTLLGKLPASTSVSGALDKLDFQKILRMGIVVFLGTFCTFVSTTGLTETNLFTVLQDAAQAGLSAVGAAAFEAIRRLAVNHLS